MLNKIINELNRYTKEELEDIANEAGVSAHTLYYWTTGRTLSPRSENLINVAIALGFDIKLVKPTKLKLVK